MWCGLTSAQRSGVGRHKSYPDERSFIFGASSRPSSRFWSRWCQRNNRRYGLSHGVWRAQCLLNLLFELFEKTLKGRKMRGVLHWEMMMLWIFLTRCSKGGECFILHRVILSESDVIDTSRCYFQVQNLITSDEDEVLYHFRRSGFVFVATLSHMIGQLWERERERWLLLYEKFGLFLLVRHLSLQQYPELIDF